MEPVTSPDTLTRGRISNKDVVLAYLKSFDSSWRAGGWLIDVFTGEHVGNGTLEAFTDGKWYWDSETIYYFDVYDAVLNEEFLKMFA